MTALNELVGIVFNFPCHRRLYQIILAAGCFDPPV
jgi:hypothetical protein